MKTLLVIDTSSDICIVGILHKGLQLQKVQHGQKKHGQYILSLIDALLVECGINLGQVDGIVFGAGPGSFTGLRIAACLTQGLAVSQGLAVYAVSSLRAMAQAIYRQYGHTEVWVVKDARMNEVYHAPFKLDSGIMQPQQSEAVEPLSQLSFNENPYVFAGDGICNYATCIAKSDLNQLNYIEKASVESQDLITLALADNKPLAAHMALPSYIRNQVTHQKSNIKKN